jgi:N-acetylmuramoyl-L-alanine amidase
MVDNHIFQMPAATIWHKREIYVPLKYFIPLLNRRTFLQYDYDPSRRTLRINSSGFNINDLTISKKQNGTVIRIRTLKDFLDDEITADMRNGWLHIDFYGGKVDSKKVKASKTEGLIKTINTFQFPELASIAFKLRKEPLARELINNSQNNEILLVLRTKEKVTGEELTELAEPDGVNKKDDLMRQLKEERNKWLIDVVVIDPGHGGRDPGTVGRNKTYEKDIVLTIALKLGEIIKKEMPGVKVIFTRKKDEFIELRRRTAIANQNKGKVFISIHANASVRKQVRGFETYFLGPEKGDSAREVVLQENSVIEFEDSVSRKQYEDMKSFILANMLQQTNMKHSEHLASLVQNNLNRELKIINMSNRGVKQGPFLVMVRATMPNILVEVGYVSNSHDMRILKTGKYQRKIALGIFQGLREYKRDIENAI